MNSPRKSNKTILICPLNWGLGHASRCIPIIHALLKSGNQIILASDGPALSLLKKEFPHLKTIELPSYNIKYRSGNMVFNILSQLPKIYRAFRKELKVVQRVVAEHKVDIIISDNRYGCRTNETLNLILCHQIQIQSKFWLWRKLARKVNLHFLNKFESCWIPDTEFNTFAGKLSHAKGLKNYFYIGPLSRLKHSNVHPNYELIVILSGPEPERSQFEMKILSQLIELPFKSVLVRGTNKKRAYSTIYKNVEIFDLLSGFELNTMISRSKFVLCRSGYSSIMDLYKLQKQAILIPTKGQTEQEYLATHLMKEGIFFSCPEKELNIETTLKELAQYPGFSDIVTEECDFQELLESYFT